MKKAIFLAAIIIGLLSSCKKDDNQIAAGLTVVKDGLAWNALNVYTGFKPLDTKDTLFIVGRNNEENIIIALKQKGAGSYQQTEFKAYYYTTIGLDVIINKYQMDDNPNNSIIISEYNETTKTIKGTFNLTLKSTYNYNNFYPGTVTFTNGKLNTQLSAVYMNPYR